MTRAVVVAIGLLTVGPAVAQESASRAPAPRRSAERSTAVRLEALRRDPAALRGFLQAFPKGADLHTHLGGAAYAETYVSYAADLALCFDLSSRAYTEADRRDGSVVCRAPATQRPAAEALRDPELYRVIIDSLSMRNHDPSDGAGDDRFFDSFDRFSAVLRASQPGVDLIAKLLAEVVTRAGRQHVHYVEMMAGISDPGLGALVRDVPWQGPDDLAGYRERLLAAGLRDAIPGRRQWLDEAERAMRAAMACDTPKASPGCGVTLRYQMYGLRALPPPVVFAQLLFGFEMVAADPRVVGVNFVQPEDWFVPRRDYELHMRMFEFLHQQYPAVPVTLHAGELGFGQVPPEDLGWHVRRAVEGGVARRIGHGADVMFDARADDLLRDMARRRIAVEVNLTSNDFILGLRGPAHPLRAYLRAGVPVILTTDDEGVSRSDLTREYERAVLEHGVTYAELKAISRAGIQHGFLPEDDKRRLLARLDQAFAAFERRFH